jgi:hypothetical protein
MNRTLLFILLLLITIPLFSQKCEEIDSTLGGNAAFFNLTEQSNLEILNNSNLTSDEKFYLLFYDNLPENTSLLSSIENYNSAMNLSCTPKGTEIHNGNYINDAWVKIITVMPSIHENNETWSLPAGKVITAFEYNISIPRSATNINGDCGPTYSIISSSSNVSTHVNGVKIGGAGINNYNIPKNSENLTVEATLNIFVNVKKNIYETYCYCCKLNEKNICIEICCLCKYSYSTNEEERTSIKDSLERTLYNFEAHPKLTMLHCQSDALSTASGNLSLNSTNNYQVFFMKFNNAYLNLTKSKLDIIVTTLPYKILELKVVDANEKFSEGIYIPEVIYSQNSTSFNFTGLFYGEIKNASKLNLRLVDLFGTEYDLGNETSIKCPSKTEIKIHSNNILKEGEKFNTTVELTSNGSPLANKKVNLFYAGTINNAYTDSNGKTIFELIANQGAIEAKFDYDGEHEGAYARKIIFVYTNSTLQQILNFISMLILLFLTYFGFKLIFGGIL